MYRLATLLVLACALHAPIHANGGGADLNAVYSSGKVKLVPAPELSVESETIDIRFEGEYAKVRTTYSLLNAAEARTFDFAFAVDAVKDNFGWGEPWDGVSDVSREWALMLPEFSISQSGVARKVVARDEEYKAWAYGRDTAILRRWMIATLVLARGANEIVVEYRIQLASAEYGWDTKGPRPHGLYPDRSDGVFIYDLAPSGSFGNGRAKRLTVSYDFSAALAAGFRVVESFPLGAVSGADTVTATWEDFDYASAPPLRVELDPLGYLLRTGSERAPLPVASVRASSILGTAYGAEKAVDGDLSTAWAEGAPGPGIGEWIEFSFPEGAGPRLLLVAGGFMANARLYDANNRVARLRIEFGYEGRKPEAVEVDVAPRAYPVSVPFSSFHEYATAIPLRTPICVSVRITVLAVEAGSRYDDTCLAEVRFY